MDDFGKMFTYYVETYTYEGHCKSNDFGHKVSISSLVLETMGELKLLIKIKLMKAKVCVVIISSLTYSLPD